MNIEKAIEILTIHQDLLLHAREPELRNALQLGIEALKEYNDLRDNCIISPDHLLPGETEE